MVKGVSRQVIVLQSPDREYFEQAIFILKEGQARVTDDTLLREANRLFSTRNFARGRNTVMQRLLCAVGGSLVTGAVWLLSALF